MTQHQFRKEQAKSVAMRSLVEKIHEAGAERHFTRWLEINQLAVGAISQLGLDSTDIKTKALASLLCLRFLDRYFKLGLSDDPSIEQIKRVLKI